MVSGWLQNYDSLTGRSTGKVRLRQARRIAKMPSVRASRERSRINMLIYAMGDVADDVLHSFKLSAANLKKYDAVKKAFDEHFSGSEKYYIRESKVQPALPRR